MGAGEVTERLIVPVSKTGVSERIPGVQIPPSPLVRTRKRSASLRSSKSRYSPADSGLMRRILPGRLLADIN